MTIIYFYTSNFVSKFKVEFEIKNKLSGKKKKRTRKYCRIGHILQNLYYIKIKKIIVSLLFCIEIKVFDLKTCLLY